MSEIAPIVIEPRLALCAKHGRSIPLPDAFLPIGMWLLMQILASDEVVAMIPERDENGKAPVELAMPVLREFSPWCEQEFIDQKEFRRVHELVKTEEGRREVYAILKAQQDELRAQREAGEEVTG